MKTRLAKKIVCTPINYLSEYWFNQFRGGRDTRIEQALRIVKRKHYGKEKR